MDRDVQPGMVWVQRLGLLLGSVVRACLGIWGIRSLPQGLFLIHPLSAGQRGNMGPLAKLILGKCQCSKPRRALGVDVPCCLSHCLPSAVTPFMAFTSLPHFCTAAEA